MKAKKSKTIIFIVGLFVLMYITVFLSMRAYSGSVSSSCLECSFERDIFVNVLVAIILFLLKSVLLRIVLKNTKWYKIIISLIFILLIFYINYNIFTDRVSSWSTYSFNECMIVVLFDSYLYVLGAFFLFWISSNLLIKNNTRSK